MNRQPGEDFGLLLEAVQAGAPVPEDSRYAGELRIAVALSALARPPSLAFEQALGSRLAAQAGTWGVYSQRGCGFGMPRMVYAGLAAATIATSVALAATPAGPALADAVERLIHVFVQETAPDVPGAPEVGHGVRPQPSSSFESLAAEMPAHVGYPGYLPVGWVELRTELTRMPSLGQTLVIVFGPSDGNDETTSLLVGVPEEGVDLALQGEHVVDGTFVGVIQAIGDPAGSKVLSWTDGQVLYQLFSPLPVVEILRIAESVQ